MDLRAAIEQFADMMTLGAHAVQRVADQKLDQLRRAELAEHIDEIVNQAEKLRALAIRLSND